LWAEEISFCIVLPEFNQIEADVITSGYSCCAEIELLGKHGVMLPPNMVGLTEEQVKELKLKDEFEDVCVPSGGSVTAADPVGRRNGKGGRSQRGCTFFF